MRCSSVGDRSGLFLSSGPVGARPGAPGLPQYELRQSYGRENSAFGLDREGSGDVDEPEMEPGCLR